MADHTTPINGGAPLGTTREEEDAEFTFTSSSDSSGAPAAARPSGLVQRASTVNPAAFGGKIFVNHTEGLIQEYFPTEGAPGGPRFSPTMPPGPFLPQLPIPAASPPHIPQYQKIADHVRASSLERSSNVSRAPALSGAGQEAQQGVGWAPSKSQSLGSSLKAIRPLLPR